MKLAEKILAEATEPKIKIFFRKKDVSSKADVGSILKKLDMSGALVSIGRDPNSSQVFAICHKQKGDSIEEIESTEGVASAVEIK